jgi:adenylate cyclase
MSKRVFTTLRQFPWSPLVCFGLAWLLMQAEPMKQLAWRTLDWRIKLRAHFQKPPDPRVEIILFGDETEINLVSWPPDRAYHGMMAELLSVAGAKVQVWDVILDGSREGDGDLSMSYGVAAAMEQGSQVITGSMTDPGPMNNDPEFAGPTKSFSKVTGDMSAVYGDEDVILPFPLLRNVSWHGIVDAPSGRDGIIREMPLVVRVGTELYPSLSLQTLMTYYGVEADAVEVRLGDAVTFQTEETNVRIPISFEGKYFINYRYDHDDTMPDFLTRSYAEVLLKLNSFYVDGVQDGPPPPDYTGNIVLIGQTVTGRADAGPTPRGAYSPLVLMHANVVNNVLANDYARKVPDWLAWWIMIGLTYLCAWLALKKSMRLLAIVSLFVIVAHLSFSFWGWVGWSLWFPWVGPLIGVTGSLLVVIGRRVRQEQKAKAEIRGMFGSYLSPVVVQKMVGSSSKPALGGVTEEITAYFSDIQGFSAFSEQLPAERLVELLNEYLTACTDVIQNEFGTLDKYIGDAVVAMFGAPVELPDHAYRACVTALKVQDQLAELRQKWSDEGDKWPELVRSMRTRIGLNTGPCMIGNMGSRMRFSYTMMGDDVNLAARMESGAKSWGAYTMCAEATKLACEAHSGDQIVFRSLGRVVVSGRSQATPIYEVVGLRESLSEDTRECLSLFANGLEHYYARDWEKSKNCFKQSAEKEPHIPGKDLGVANNPSLVYLDIIKQYLNDPPDADWDGVHVMKEK